MKFKQGKLFETETQYRISPLKLQLLKWIGNKQRFSHEIASYFPPRINRYFEPFLGSGAVLATLAHNNSFGSDIFKPLIEIWMALKTDPEKLKKWYEERWNAFMKGNGDKDEYYRIRKSYNSNPNGADLLFLCRACYGGVVRFRKADGFMSTPCGVHKPMPPDNFNHRVDVWRERTAGTEFALMDYEEAMGMAELGDMVYCDPPYLHSQAILYGGQAFKIEHLFEVIEQCKARGVNVALSIDGTKKSGKLMCELPIPKGLFERQVFVNCGRSMLKRFQMEGETLENEIVSDRLLLTY